MRVCKPIVPDLLKKHTVCLTGFTGYIGRHLVDTLIGSGIRPFLIGRPGGIVNVMPGADYALPWDTPEALARQLDSLEDPVLINISGHFVSRHRPSDIPSLISGNLEYPIKIFEAVSLSGIRRLVNIGTSWEYSDLGIKEPTNLYAHLKASNAAILEWYSSQSNLQAINLKLNDTYGGDDNRAKLMPLLRNCVINGKTAHLHSWAQPINLLHITDVLEGLLAAVLETEKINPGIARTVFLLSNETVTIGNLVAIIQSEAAPHLLAEFKDLQRKNMNLRAVWTDAPRLEGWVPRITLATGVNDYFGSIK